LLSTRAASARLYLSSSGRSQAHTGRLTDRTTSGDLPASRMLGARIAVSLLVAASAAAAQTTGSISGRIVDSQTSRPVSGAVIVATSPSLPGEEIAQTDR